MKAQKAIVATRLNIINGVYLKKIYFLIDAIQSVKKRPIFFTKLKRA